MTDKNRKSKVKVIDIIIFILNVVILSAVWGIANTSGVEYGMMALLTLIYLEVSK